MDLDVVLLLQVATWVKKFLHRRLESICVLMFSFLGAKRPRVSSGGVSESPSGFSKHIQSNLDFSPGHAASR